MISHPKLQVNPTGLYKLTLILRPNIKLAAERNNLLILGKRFSLLTKACSRNVEDDGEHIAAKAKIEWLRRLIDFKGPHFILCLVFY